MKIYQTLVPDQPPFVLINRKVGRSYFWTNPSRAENRDDGGEPVDLPIVDAMALAKLQKLSVVLLTNPDRLHVVGVLGEADFDKEKIGVVRVGLTYEFDDVYGAVPRGELFALCGSAHGDSKKTTTVAGGVAA